MIWGLKIGTGSSFSPNAVVFPCQYYSTKCPYSSSRSLYFISEGQAGDTCALQAVLFRMCGRSELSDESTTCRWWRYWDKLYTLTVRVSLLIFAFPPRNRGSYICIALEKRKWRRGCARSLSFHFVKDLANSNYHFIRKITCSQFLTTHGALRGLNRMFIVWDAPLSFGKSCRHKRSNCRYKRSNCRYKRSKCRYQCRSRRHWPVSCR